MAGQNPYDMRLVTEQVHRAGNDPKRFPNADPIQVSVYLPTVFPLMAGIAWLPWEPARLVWCCLSALAIAASLPFFFIRMDLSASGKWLVAALIFSFFPASLGLSHGNPSVIACSMTMLAAYLVLNGRNGIAALALGVAHCMKPQISIAAVALFALWGCWRPLLLSFVLPALAGIVSILRAASLSEYGHWLATLQQALAASSAPGGVNDPSLANYWAYSIANVQALLSVWMRNPHLVNVGTWLIAGALVLVYLLFRSDLEGDKRLRDMAFFSAVTLTIVYHRFYDEQLLLMAIPFLLTSGEKRKPIVIVLWLCILILWLPLHLLSRHFSSEVAPTALLGVLLLRPQPIILLGICLLLIPWQVKLNKPEAALRATR
jgi:Glycosyltransferase family 87